MAIKTVNSLSGGRTSSYMACHYPADYNIFALIMIEDVSCAPKDVSLIKKVSDKIGCDFIATAEDDKTLTLMLNLEQKIGSEITWLRGETFDQLIRKRKRLPNRLWRFCTQEMKMKPIFDWWKGNFEEPIEMRIGYRYDESERANRFTEEMKVVVGRTKTGNRNRWGNIKWRYGKFPLIEDKIIHPKVRSWSLTSGLVFPDDSNCVGCFWKADQQIRKNWEDNPEKMTWFANQEVKGTWKNGVKYDEIKQMYLQSEFQFGTGAGCQAGFCTD
jgi:hypothetical protein